MTTEVPITNNAALRVDTAGTFVLSRNLTNNGLLSLNGDGDIGGGSQLLNDGTLRKSAGTGVSLVSPGSLTAVGPDFDVHTGTVQIGVGSTLGGGGTFTVADGSLLTFERPGVEAP